MFHAFRFLGTGSLRSAAWLLIWAAWLALLFFALAGCNSSRSQGGQRDGTLALTLKNVEVVAIKVHVYGVVKVPTQPFFLTPYTLQIKVYGDFTVPAKSEVTEFLSPVPEALGVVGPGGWPHHTRRRVQDYKTAITVEIP